MNGILEILILSDGKPGHENQSHGLAEAIGRLRAVHISTISMAGRKGAFSRVLHALKGLRQLPKPMLLIGAGHSVHIALLALAKKTDAPCVVLMKPTLPSSFFDLCLVPEHDIRDRIAPKNMVPTMGALNRIQTPGAAPRSKGLVLIGGPSSSYGWDGAAITTAVESVVRSAPERAWRITDSRRTPPDFLAKLGATIPQVSVFPHQETSRDWLPRQLSEAAETWVTEDSVSMIYEALSSGSKVGILPVPALKKAGRVAKGIEKLVKEGFVTPFPLWSPEKGLAAPPRILREADRCAAIVMQRLFSE